MKFHALSAIAVSASFAVFSLSVSALGAAEPLSTDRLVHGVITSVDPAVVTIASSLRSVTGKIDPTRTKIRLHGKPAKLSDLKVTSHAKAELGLDETWTSIDEH